MSFIALTTILTLFLHHGAFASEHQSCVEFNKLDSSSPGISYPFFNPTSKDQQSSPPPIRNHGYGVEYYDKQQLFSAICNSWDPSIPEEKHGAISSCRGWCISKVSEDEKMYPNFLLDQNKICNECAKEESKKKQECAAIKILKIGERYQIQSSSENKTEISVNTDGDLLFIPVNGSKEKLFYKVSRKSIYQDKTEFEKQFPVLKKLTTRGDEPMPNAWFLANTKVTIASGTGKITNEINRQQRSYSLRKNRRYGIRICDQVQLDPGVCSNVDYEFQTPKAFHPNRLKPNCFGYDKDPIPHLPPADINNDPNHRATIKAN